MGGAAEKSAYSARSTMSPFDALRTMLRAPLPGGGGEGPGVLESALSEDDLEALGPPPRALLDVPSLAPRAPLMRGELVEFGRMVEDKPARCARGDGEVLLIDCQVDFLGWLTASCPARHRPAVAAESTSAEGTPTGLVSVVLLEQQHDRYPQMVPIVRRRHHLDASVMEPVDR